MRIGLLLAVGLAVVAGLARPSPAQLIPPLEEGEQLVTSKLVGDEVEMRDADDGSPLIMPKGIKLWDDKNEANNLQPEISFQAQPTGFDIIYTFTNSGQNNRKLGALNMGIMTLGSRVDYPDLRYICENKYADYIEGYKVRQMHYPDTLYSPAWILQNDDYAIGVSLQYPILDVKHTVRLTLYSPEGKYAYGEGGRGWRLEFLLSNVGNETEENKLTYPGLIGPGESWTYVMSVRVTKKPNEWVRTVLPYRNWFRGQYGGVAYDRQTRCLNGRAWTSADRCTDENPFGYGDSRPDLNTWGPAINTLLERQNWDTIMAWTPSGTYRYNTDNNMPYQFTSNWNATEALATAYDPEIGFPRLPAAGQKIGFWWGRSVQVALEWDAEELVPFNPDNQGHRTRAFAEIDLAVKAGATTIGMDTFSPRITPVWKLIPWIRDLKARHPGLRFCAEPVSSDLIHREVATFYRGNKDRYEVEHPDEIDGFYNPHYMADFLLPGHEIWGSYRWATYEEFGIFHTDEEKTEQLRKIASLGYVPISMDAFDLKDSTIEAAKSWEFTVPPDLRIPPDDDGEDPFPTFELFNAAFKAGNMEADLNKDGILNFFDYTTWQNYHLPPGKEGGDDDATAGLDEDRSPKGSTARQAPRTASKEPARKPTRSAAASRRPTRRAKPDRTPRLELVVTDLSPTDAPPPSPLRRGFSVNATPINFTSDEIARAIARAKGLDASALETADAIDDDR
jgi:hypothetical protein